MNDRAHEFDAHDFFRSDQLPTMDPPKHTDHRVQFRKKLIRQEREGAGVGGVDGEVEHSPLAWLYDTFSAYIEDRRLNPKGDILTGLAAATFPDGSVPEPPDVARIAATPAPAPHWRGPKRWSASTACSTAPATFAYRRKSMGRQAHGATAICPPSYCAD